MKLSALVFLSLLGLASASLQDTVNGSSLHDIVNGSSLLPFMRWSSQHRRVSLLNPELQDRVPLVRSDILVPGPLTPAEFEDQQHPEKEARSSIFGDNVNLEWLTWTGSLPNGAVSIFNGYTSRTDYVCKHGCSAGFYNPSLGPHCRYPYGEQEHYAPYFEILANKDNFEFLEWKDGSYGSVPPHSVMTCGGTYVGKNEYGLGKVVPRFEAFFLPWEGWEYWYKHYQVLTINRDTYSQHISDVKYLINEAELIQHKPEIMISSTVENNECRDVVKTVTISKTTEKEDTWNIGRSTTQGVKGSITAGIPFIGEGSVEISTEQTLEFNSGTTIMESLSHTVTVEVTIPPNHSCTVHMEGRQMVADVPYKARLSRTYRNGGTQWTSITGTYDGVQIGDVRTVINRCEPMANAKPCHEDADIN